MISDSWFLYRLPGASQLNAGVGNTIKGFGEQGFAIAPFIASPEDLITISAVSETIVDLDHIDSIPQLITTISFSDIFLPDIEFQDFTAYERNIIRIKEFLQTSDPEGKVVFSRRILHKDPIDLLSTFQQLCKAYPNAFIFAFSTPDSGCWLGASPETLLKGEYISLHDSDTSELKLETMALAGTRPASTDNRAWDNKNSKEQKIVADYICNLFSKYGLSPEVGPTETLKAGPVEHICTPIVGKLSTPVGNCTDHSLSISEFLCEYSPTPALCGSAQRSELSLIEEIEESPRDFYGGWCGPVDKNGFRLFVNLRSAKLFLSAPDSIPAPILPKFRALLFVGGGITINSEPEAEWQETINKSKTLLSVFQS